MAQSSNSTILISKVHVVIIVASALLPFVYFFLFVTCTCWLVLYGTSLGKSQVRTLSTVLLFAAIHSSLRAMTPFFLLFPQSFLFLRYSRESYCDHWYFCSTPKCLFYLFVTSTCNLILLFPKFLFFRFLGLRSWIAISLLSSQSHYAHNIHHMHWSF